MEKRNLIQNHFLKKIVVSNDTAIDLLSITENLISHFTKIGPKLASKFENSTVSFDSYMKK